MKKQFNLSRFNRLFIKHTVEHYKSYLMSLLVLIGVMLLGGVFIIYMINEPMNVSSQNAFFTIILLLAGTIFASTVFAQLGDKKKAMVWLTLPASHFEKYLVVWLYSFLLLIIVYTGSFYLVLLFLNTVKHFPGHQNEVLNIFSKGGGLQVFLLFGLLHSIAFYGAVYFEKLHFIKTAFIFFIGLGILIAINNFVQRALMGNFIMMNVPFGGAMFMENHQTKAINITEAQQGHILILVAVLTILFWAAAYYRLKEKQV